MFIFFSFFVFISDAKINKPYIAYKLKQIPLYVNVKN